MTEQHEDDDLRELFAAQREANGCRVPGFARMYRMARNAGPGRKPETAGPSRWLPCAVAVLVIAMTASMWFARRPPAAENAVRAAALAAGLDEAGEHLQARLIAENALAWQSPTDFLLPSSLNHP